jgi:hypothetical protein
MAMTMKIAVFWDLTPCSLVDIYQYFGGTCCSHFQGEEQATHIGICGKQARQRLVPQTG